MYKSCDLQKNEISPFRDDCETDSLSMHLSDIDSVCSIVGERFFDEKEDFYYDDATSIQQHYFDIDPIPISTERTAIVQLPEVLDVFPLQEEHQSDESSDVSSGDVWYDEISHLPEFVSLNDFEAAIAQSKKTHDDLLQWDRNNGVKKGFSRTMSNTKSSRALVQSALKDRKRMFESQIGGNRAQKRRFTI